MPEMPEVGATTVAVVLSMIALLGTLATLWFGRRTAKDAQDADIAKTVMANLMTQVESNSKEIVRLRTVEDTLLEEGRKADERHKAELDAMRIERDVEKDAKHKVQSEFQHAELVYQKNLDDMELRYHKEAAELKRCYELEIAELRHEVQQLRDLLTGAGIPVPKKASNHEQGMQ